MITAQECIRVIREALKQFGEHSYYDKGANEVIDTDAIVKKMEGMTGKQIADVLADVRKFKHGEIFVRDILVDLQERSDIDDLYSDSRVSDLY